MKLILSTALLTAGLLTGCQTNPAQSNAGSAQSATGSAEDRSTNGVDGQTATLHVKGMSCPLCADNISNQLQRIKGVELVKIDLGTGKVLAKLSPKGPPSRDQLTGAIERSGFTLERIEMPSSQRSAP